MKKIIFFISTNNNSIKYIINKTLKLKNTKIIYNVMIYLFKKLITIKKLIFIKDLLEYVDNNLNFYNFLSFLQIITTLVQ